MRIRVRASLGAVLGLAVWAHGAGAESYGFGSIVRRSVVVDRRLAPEVQLANVSLHVVFPRGSGGLDQQRFISQLETDIVQGGQNIALQEHDPQYEIRLEVTGFDRPRVDRQTDKGVTTYTEAGSATVAFQLVHHVDGRVVLAGTESYTVGNVLNSSGGGRTLFGVPLNGGGANQKTTDDSVAQKLITQLAIQVASHMVITDEAVPMLLAKGPGLDQADKLAEAKRWNEYLEALSTMTPAPNTADDAYRIYDLGVANEALGYAADDPKVTLKYLREASINYTKAMEDHGTEKYFTQCQGRIEKALARYTTLDERNKQASRLQAEDQKQAAATAERKKAGGIDNVDIIKLVRAGVDPSIIILKIRTAPVVDFDLSTDGLVQLSQNGVKANLINEMTQRMQGPAPASALPPARPVHR